MANAEYVQLTEQELDSLTVDANTNTQLTEFVPIADPIYFGSSY